MARNYELTFIARPEIDPASLTALIERVKGFITAESGTVVKVDQWGVRRLSYPINKIRDGQYVYLFVQLEAQSVQRVESRLKLIEPIIRYLLVKSEDTNITKVESVEGVESVATEAAAPVETVPAVEATEAVPAEVVPEVAPVAAVVEEATPTAPVVSDAVVSDAVDTPTEVSAAVAGDESSQTQEQKQPAPVAE